MHLNQCLFISWNQVSNCKLSFSTFPFWTMRGISTLHLRFVFGWYKGQRIREEDHSRLLVLQIRSFIARHWIPLSSRMKPIHVGLLGKFLPQRYGTLCVPHEQATPRSTSLWFWVQCSRFIQNCRKLRNISEEVMVPAPLTRIVQHIVKYYPPERPFLRYSCFFILDTKYC